MKPKNKNLSQPSLTLIICDPRYEMKIISQKKKQNKSQSSGSTKSVSNDENEKKNQYLKRIKKRI
jgi:hypothetical protein